jgi:Immunity protein Imm1
VTYTAEAYYGTHGAEPAVLSTPADVDRMIDALLSNDWSDTVASVYLRERPLNAAGVPDHELLVAVNPDDKVGGLFYNGHQGEPASLYSKGASVKADSAFYYYFGNEREFPAGSQISIETIRAAVKEFLMTGNRPTVVEWQAAPGDDRH